MKKILFITLILTLSFTMFGCKNKTPETSTPEVSINSMEQIGTDRFKEILAEHRGKVVLVNFFGSWCPPCKAETPDFIQVYEKYKPTNNFVIIGIAVDQEKQNAIDFVNTFNVTYPVYQADSGLLSYFQIRPIPTSFVFDQNGNLLDMMQGFMHKDIVEQIAQYKGE